MVAIPANAEPLISIIMPLYNKAAEVIDTIATVQAQTIPDWELVVVDDGSQDGGADLVRALNDPRINVHTQTNRGVSAARNKGIALAASDLIAFLDADDEWLPGFLAAVLNLKRDYPEANWYATGYQIRHPREGLFNSRLRGVHPGFTRGVMTDYFCVAIKSDPPVWSSAVVVQRSALDAIGGFPVGIASGEDLLTWARLAMRYPLAYDTCSLAVFHVSGLDRRPDPDERVASGLRTLLDASPQTAGLRAYLGLWYRMQAVMAMRFDETILARRCAEQAVRYGLLQWRNIYTLLLAWMPGKWRHFIDRTARRLANRQKSLNN